MLENRFSLARSLAIGKVFGATCVDKHEIYKTKAKLISDKILKVLFTAHAVLDEKPNQPTSHGNPTTLS